MFRNKPIDWSAEIKKSGGYELDNGREFNRKNHQTFWKKKVIDRLKNTEGVNATIIDSFVRYNIIKKMYENLTDKWIIVDCGKKIK